MKRSTQKVQANNLDRLAMPAELDQPGVIDFKKVDFSILGQKKFSEAEAQAVGMSAGEFKSPYGQIIQALIAVLVLEAISATILLLVRGLSDAIIPYVFTVMLALLVWYLSTRDSSHEVRMIMFARANGFTYRKVGNTSLYKQLFSNLKCVLGRGGTVSANISEIIFNEQMKYIPYYTSESYSSNSKSHTGGCVIYQLLRPVPSLLLTSKEGPTNEYSSTMMNFNLYKHVQLDYNLDGRFYLYSDDKIAALSIFTPEVLLLVNSYGMTSDIEIYGDYVYITNGNASSEYNDKSSVVNFLTYANVLAREIGEAVNRTVVGNT
jgi:hypothetical protein